MNINVGDKVRLLNENGEGTVKKVISKNEIWVEVDDFEYPFALHEFIRIGENNEVNHTPSDKIDHPELNSIKTTPSKFKFSRKKGAVSNVFKKMNPRGIPEIDLHIEQLTADTSITMDKREALSFQMEYLKYILEEAERNLVRELIIIHGKGEGVLKTEVRRLLGSLPNIEFWDGAFQFYSTGATHVKMYY